MSTKTRLSKESDNSAVLKIEGISIKFGGVQAVDNLSFAVKRGELLGFIGPNGAGKTTALNIITGVLKPDAGRIELKGKDISSLPTYSRIRSGMAITHQIVKPLRSMTVLDNVVLAAGLRRTLRPFGSLFHIGQKNETAVARDILAQVGLNEVENNDADALPLGQLKRLEVARALAMNPELIMFDEPLAGLNEKESATLVDTIVNLNTQGLTAVLVEHNLGEVLRVSSRLIVLDNGRLIADGNPNEVMENPIVQEAYLGGGSCDAEA